MIDIKQALTQAADLLHPTSTSAQLDAEVLLAYTLGKSRTFLYTYPEKTLDQSIYDVFKQLVTKRSEGQPIAYLVGLKEFWSLPLQITKDTLIPRPETELLVELTLLLLKDVSKASIIDLGTGSGAIALALASERPDWELLACDNKQVAVETAHKNATNLGLSNVNVCLSNWFLAMPTKRFHAIVSNPPYIAKEDPHLKQGDVRFEPPEALVSGTDGMEDLNYIIQNSYDHLLPEGLLLLEHGYDQKEAVTSMLAKCDYQRINSWQDSEGRDRVSGGWRL